MKGAFGKISLYLLSVLSLTLRFVRLVSEWVRFFFPFLDSRPCSRSSVPKMAWLAVEGAIVSFFFYSVHVQIYIDLKKKRMKSCKWIKKAKKLFTDLENIIYDVFNINVLDIYDIYMAHFKNVFGLNFCNFMCKVYWRHSVVRLIVLMIV